MSERESKFDKISKTEKYIESDIQFSQQNNDAEVLNYQLENSYKNIDLNSCRSISPLIYNDKPFSN